MVFAIMLITACATDPDVREQPLTTREQQIIVTSSCATMFSYAAESALPWDKDLFFRKFRYMTNRLFSDLRVTGASEYQLIDKGNRLTMQSMISQKAYDGGFRYNGAMALCETLYDELI